MTDMREEKIIKAIREAMKGSAQLFAIKTESVLDSSDDYISTLVTLTPVDDVDQFWEDTVFTKESCHIQFDMVEDEEPVMIIGEDTEQEITRANIYAQLYWSAVRKPESEQAARTGGEVEAECWRDLALGEKIKVGDRCLRDDRWFTIEPEHLEYTDTVYKASYPLQRRVTTPAAAVPDGWRETIALAAGHLGDWLDAHECECEMGHICGRQNVEQTRQRLLDMLAAPQPVGESEKVAELEATLKSETERLGRIIGRERELVEKFRELLLQTSNAMIDEGIHHTHKAIKKIREARHEW